MGHLRSRPVCCIHDVRGGGFATIPAFLADMFGAENVGAIHGVILTAWSAAAIAGPVIITELSNRAKANLTPGASKIHTSTINLLKCWRRCSLWASS